MSNNDKYTKSIGYGISGEALALARLAEGGFVATLTYKNSPNFDILACSPNGESTANIQVKTSGTTDCLIIPRDSEQWMKTKNSFFAFVILDKKQVWWIPAIDIANYIENTPLIKKDGTPYSATSPRTMYLSKTFPTAKAENIEILKNGNVPTYYKGGK